MHLRRKPTSQILTTLSFLFICGLGLRIATATSVALAAGADESTFEQACAAVDAPEALVAALQDREQALDAREARADQHQQELVQLRAELAEQMDALHQAEAELRQHLAIVDQGAEAELAQLTSVYEAMKPADAARLFSEMNPEFAAGFLGRMSPQAAAGILAGLDPAEAYAMSVVLAGRNATLPGTGAGPPSE